MEGSVSPKAFHGGRKTQSYMVKLDLKFMKNISKVSPKAGEARYTTIFERDFELELSKKSRQIKARQKLLTAFLRTLI